MDEKKLIKSLGKVEFPRGEGHSKGSGSAGSTEIWQELQFNRIQSQPGSLPV
jgi:hypothetical protein